MKKIFSLLFIAFLSLGAIAQSTHDSIVQNDEIINQEKPYLNNYITWSPLSLLEIEPSLQLGYMHKVGENKMLHYEVGYVGLMNGMYQLFRIANWDVESNDINSYGFRIRTSFRKYLTDTYGDKYGRSNYIGVDLMYKFLSVTENDVAVWRMNWQYQELYDINWQKSVGAIHFVYGSTNYMSYTNKIIIDKYVGIGLRNKFLSNNVPKDVNIDPIWYDDTFNGMFVSVMLGIKIGFGV